MILFPFSVLVSVLCLASDGTFSFHRCFQNADGDFLIGKLVVLLFMPYIYFKIVIFFIFQD